VENKQLNNLDEAIALLEKKAIRTSAGDFVKMEDVRRLIVEEKEAKKLVEEDESSKPRNMVAAKRAIMKDPEIMKNFPPPRREPGKSIPAGPQPSSRT
jgi:hypothetical protein